MRDRLAPAVAVVDGDEGLLAGGRREGGEHDARVLHVVPEARVHVLEGLPEAEVLYGVLIRKFGGAPRFTLRIQSLIFLEAQTRCLIFFRTQIEQTASVSALQTTQRRTFYM